MEVRSINTYYGTHYNPDDLDAWAEVDIAEAVKFAQMMEQREQRT